MIYLDTSFLLPLFRPEAVSDKVSKYLAARSADAYSISAWTRIEFSSALSREVRMKSIDEASAGALIKAFADLAEESLQFLVPSAADFDLAHEFVARFATKLRGPDALHLAIASNNAVEEILSLDNGLLSAAKLLKIKARRGIRGG